nr:MAG TPA: hypothetical protein [Caudoviricetes sp.]
MASSAVILAVSTNLFAASKKPSSFKIAPTSMSGKLLESS